MSVRYRLFIWVGSLFLVGFVVAALLQSKLTDQNLIQASQNLKEKLFNLSDLKRESIEKYVRMSLSASCGEIRALLDTIAAYSTYESGFAPIDENDHHYNWGRSADLLIDNKWVEFVQNIGGDKVLSILTPNDALPQKIKRVLINEAFAWISFPSDPAIYLGVLCQKKESGIIEEKTIDIELIGQKDPHVYLVFSKEALEDLSSKWPLAYNPSNAGYIAPYFFEFYGALTLSDFISSFSDKLKNAFGLFAKWPTSQDIFAESMKKEQTIEKSLIDISYDELLERNRIIAMIAFLASYYETGFTGYSPNSKGVPLAMSYFLDGELEGIGILAKNAFRTEPYPVENAEKEIILIQDLAMGKVYVGESLFIQAEEHDTKKKGTLTVGINPSGLGKLLALSNREISLVVSNEQIIGAFSIEGEPIDKASLGNIPIAKMSSEDKGFVHWNNEDYFFLKITPFQEIDLHYFLFNPKSKEFAVVQYLEQGTKDLIDHLAVHMRQIAIVALACVLICLNFLAKRITRPIVQLAKATDKVAHGSLEEIDLSFAKGHTDDEIFVLCDSFAKMVKELQEKEKVRSVLNKVVSPQIASEILENPMQLGGEEKQMTMLFADIRNFTKITEKMPPHEVIEMLNLCMTKLSDQIDMYYGVIDKYVGDEVMALFGLPEHSKDTMLKAILSSLGMMDAMKLWNEERKKIGLAPIDIGIGVHSGVVVAGNMGAKNRLNYTVLGSGVNLGARLCAIAKGGEILVTETVAMDPEVKAAIQLEKMEPMVFKGFSEPIAVYRVMGRI